jgi:hypothetical protein
MWAYCLRLLQQSDSAYALHAARWYEKNEPEDLAGLGERMEKEIAKRRATDERVQPQAHR